MERGAICGLESLGVEQLWVKAHARWLVAGHLELVLRQGVLRIPRELVESELRAGRRVIVG